MDQVLVGTEDRIRYCAGCAGERLFERPPCAHGHGSDCPERACTVCGHAMLVDSLPAPGVPVLRAAT